MAVEKEQKIRITADSSQAQRAFSDLGAKIITVNQAMELGKKAGEMLGGSLGAVIDLAQRGQAIEGLNTAFKNLYGSANALGSDGLAKLSAALGETVNNVNILKEANEAALRGMDPKVFLKIAESADALGRTVGESTTEAFEGLSKALETGNKKMLAHYGITVDVTKSADGMSRAMAQLDANVKKAGDGGASAADSYDRFKSIISNTVDEVAKAINKNEDFARAFDTLGDTIKEIDWQPMIDGISSVTSLMSNLIALIPDFQRGWAVVKDYNAQRGEEVFGTPKGVSGDNLALFDLSRNIKVSQSAAELDSLRESVYGLNLSFEGQTKALNLIQDAYEKFIPKVTTASDKVGGFKNPLYDTGKAAEEAAKKIAKLGEDFEKLSRSTASDIKLSGLQRSFEEALKGGNYAGAQDLATQYQGVIHDSIKAELIKTYREAGLELSDAQIEAIAGPRSVEAGQQMADSLGESLKQAYEESTAFFTDLFYNAMTGAAFDLEDIFKRLAAGFVGSIAGAIFQIPAGITSAQGFGQWAGQQVIGAAGSFFGGGIGDVAGAAVGASGFGGFGGAIGGAGSAILNPGAFAAGASGVYLPGAAGAATSGAYGAASFGAGLAAAGPALLAGAAIAAAPMVFDFVDKKFFSGSTDPDRLARRDLRGQLQQTGFGENLEFSSTRGTKSLFDSDYNLDMSGKFANEAAGLANPLAHIFTGGDDKLGSDLAGIFANASKDVGSFNEAIVNTQSIMEKLGINAAQAKDSVTELFLDGKISIGEFSSDLQNLNTLASDNLTGKGSVSDALTIMANNFDNPRTQLKAMQFLFTEFAEIGVNGAHEIGSALVDQLGPDAQSAFDMMAQAGINSADDLKNANADMIAFIFSNVIEPLRDEFSSAFNVVSDEAQKASDKTQSSFAQIGNSTKKATDEVIKYGKALKSVAGGIATGNNDLNQGLGTTE